MNKRKLHHIWKLLKKVNYWYFLAAFLVTGFVAVMALRHNNLTALKLRQQVLQVDKDNGDTEVALKKLRQYIYGHMNTNLASSTSVYPPIQLKYRYERLLEAQKKGADSTNTKIYNDAQKHCEQLLPTGISMNRVPCIQQYLDTHPALQSQPIPDSLYKFDFASPAWSPDLAGLSMLLAGASFLIFISLFSLSQWIRSQLKANM